HVFLPELFAQLLETSSPRRDDAAAVAVRLVGDHPDVLTLVVPADSAGLRAVRHRVMHWLAGHGYTGQGLDDGVPAAGEALANAFEHGARGDRRRLIQVEAGWVDGTAVIAVADDGQWRPAAPESPHRGRGIGLMRRLAARTTVTSMP